tara:strand:+ start:1208 stop:1672 length:465 start_codon:yes stop_codon:yes gene_type:complete
MGVLFQGKKQTLTSGYGEGLTKKQKKALGFALDPGISDSQNASGDTTEDIDTVYGGADADNAAPLSLKTTTSLCISSGLGGHVSLADGVLGQVKRIIHLNRVGGADLVITPLNFAAGTNITSDNQKRSVTLMYDGDNWQVIAGEITGTAEFVIA